MADDTKTAVTIADEPEFTKEALVASKKYAGKRDAIMIALDNGKKYTMAEADAAIDKVLKTKVKEVVNGKDDE